MMKFDTSGIDRAALGRHLATTYGLPIVAVTFTPKGEEAYGFVATGAAGERFFVRAQRAPQVGHLDTVYAALVTLHDCGHDAVLAPYRTRDGRSTSQFGSYAIALFPFIDGPSAYETEISAAQWRQTADIIAALHQSGACCPVSIPARERFGNPFAARIEAALRRAASPEPPETSYQARLIALVREEEADVRATLERMRQLGNAARRLAPELVPTHGDPNLANFLIARDGSLHLTDWGELAMGPRERDLTFFTEERFAPFLRRYLELSGRARLHRALFAFYRYRWVVQEIADYSTRILAGSGDADEDAHAWAELQPYLPTNHADLQAGLDAIMRTVAALASEGLLDVDDNAPWGDACVARRRASDR